MCLVASADEINLTADITATGEELDLLSGAFSQEDLNKVDGDTASTDELNIVADSEVTQENLDTLIGVTEELVTQLQGLQDSVGSLAFPVPDEVVDPPARMLNVFSIVLGFEHEVTLDFTADDSRIGEMVLLVVWSFNNLAVSGTFTFNYTNHVGSEVSISTQSPIVRRFIRLAQGLSLIHISEPTRPY